MTEGRELRALIGRGTRFEGRVVFEERARIEGTVRGEIFGEGTLILGDNADVDARIEVGTLIVRAGTLRGEVFAKELIEVHPAALCMISLHEACYQGKLDEVRRLLTSGASPNEPATPAAREWISSAGPRPMPLNCVAIAWAMTEDHVEIAALLIAYGAVVEESVFEDHNVESVGSPQDAAFLRILSAGRPLSRP